MEPGGNNSFSGDGSMLMGAIFMSNRMTKKECLRRRVFGLPSSQAYFVKKVKAGMILFLFEYEDRKLHGVFEATSDGAINIIPDAFNSSGNVFSAQIRFRRIWFCSPLTEAEFHDAIKENYYTNNKFNFHLSEKQVLKLLSLFDTKQIKTKLHQNPGTSCKFIPEFTVGKPGKRRIDPNELNLEDGTNSRRYPSLSGTNVDRSLYHKKPLLDTAGSMLGIKTGLYPAVSLATEPRIESGLYQTVSCTTGPQLPDFICSASQNVPTFRENVPIGPVQDRPSYHLVPGLQPKQSSISLDIGRTLVQEVTPYSRVSLDSQVPFSGRKFYQSHPEPENLSLSNDYPSMAALSTPQSLSYSMYDHSNSSLHSVASENFKSCVGYTNSQDLNCPSSFSEPYDPYDAKIPLLSHGDSVSLQMDVATSVQNPGISQPHTCGYLTPTSQHGDNSRGPRYWHHEPPDVIPLSEYEYNVENLPYYSSPQKCPSEFLHSYEGVRPYISPQDHEYYPTDLKSDIYSDNCQKRTSVFSRLSGVQEACTANDETYKPKLDISLSQLMKSLSNRRKYWNKATNVPKRIISQDIDEHLEGVGKLWPNEAAALGDEELYYSEEVTEESTTPPFLNFKRRSEVRKLEGETETSACLELNESEGSSDKHKRRKLIRPSFIGSPSSKGNTVFESQEPFGGLVPAIHGRGYELNESFGASVGIRDDKQLESVGKLGPTEAAALGDGLYYREEATEEIAKLPFLNFKRRSEVLKLGDETETRVHVELKESESSLDKHKRRKLVRPSLSEDPLSKGIGEFKCSPGADQELIEAQVPAINVKGNESNGSFDASVGIRDDKLEPEKSYSVEGVSPELLIGHNISPIVDEGIRVKLSPRPHLCDAKETVINSDIIFLPSREGQCESQFSSQHYHGGPLLVINDEDKGGSGSGDASAGSGREGDRSHSDVINEQNDDHAEYSRNCDSVNQISLITVAGTRTGGLSSDFHIIQAEEAVVNIEGPNINAASLDPLVRTTREGDRSHDDMGDERLEEKVEDSRQFKYNSHNRGGMPQGHCVNPISDRIVSGIETGELLSDPHIIQVEEAVVDTKGLKVSAESRDASATTAREGGRRHDHVGCEKLEDEAENSGESKRNGHDIGSVSQGHHVDQIINVAGTGTGALLSVPHIVQAEEVMVVYTKGSQDSVGLVPSGVHNNHTKTSVRSLEGGRKGEDFSLVGCETSGLPADFECSCYDSIEVGKKDGSLSDENAEKFNVVSETDSA